MTRSSYLAKESKEYGIKVSINQAGELGYKVSAKSAKQPGSRRAAMLKAREDQKLSRHRFWWRDEQETVTKHKTHANP
jgi:hypothetical protein